MIYVITGIMASGKSTVAELLAQHFDKSVHIRGDIFRKMVVKGRAEMGKTLTEEALTQLDLRHRLAVETAIQYHQEGFTVVLQDNFYGEKLAYVVELLAPEPVQVIVLCPSVEAIRRRERERGKTGYHSFSVESLYQSFMESTPRIGLWFDNSDQTPQETVNQILEHLVEDE